MNIAKRCSRNFIVYLWKEHLVTTGILLPKIFGELFSCIEIGYRGQEHKIDTQYKNIVPSQIVIDGEKKENPFKDGFYVPDNVYVIGTMNDIDRREYGFCFPSPFCLL